MPEHLVFEQPLNERVRGFIRLDHLFRQAYHHLAGTTRWDSQAAVSALVELLDVLGRTDIKAELLKEVDRYQSALAALSKAPGVDVHRLDEILTQLTEAGGALAEYQGQLGQSLRENEFLSAIRQRKAVPGGSTHIDLPGYHYWLEQPGAARNETLHTWLAELEPARRPVALLLELLRDSSEWEPKVASTGFFQQSLNSTSPPQLIRARVPRGTGIYAEISAGRHRFSLRFVHFSDRERPRQVKDDVDFELSCCGL